MKEQKSIYVGPDAGHETFALDIAMEPYQYELPQERIPKFPLAQRDASKLLVLKGDKIQDSQFATLPQWLPEGAMLVFNNTKVVPARLFFRKDTGAVIEVFCLEPRAPKEYVLAFAQQGQSEWYCAVGNAKRWKEGPIALENPHNDPQISELGLTAMLVAKEADRYVVRFEWSANVPFSTVLERCGRIPIPPYLKREAEDLDLERYQTLYARYRGSVAAPTAGLHFSAHVLEALKDKGVDIKELTLHVGAGTFRPVKGDTIVDHVMHSEPFIVTRDFLLALRAHKALGRPLFAVGTTSCRCLESLYFLGLRAARGEDPTFVAQWEPYGRVGSELAGSCAGAGTGAFGGVCGVDGGAGVGQNNFDTMSYADALQALVDYMDVHGLTELQARTQIIIVPSYRFRALNGLITNFHQPGSTLLLLVAALIGPTWREVYRHALAHQYRFLSYGDSCLFFER